MALPLEKHVEIPLLEELEKAGGSAQPKDIYGKITPHFPNITPEDLRKTVAKGKHNAWNNCIQWARQRLKDAGQLASPERGVWAITDKGRQRLQDFRDGKEPPVTTRRKRGRPPKDMDKHPKPDASDHDELARAMLRIGEAFGFDSWWKPKTNDIRPDGKPLRAKHKALDVGWYISNIAWVPIEIQIGGSVADLIMRFNQVHQWSLRLVVVALAKYMDEIKENIYGYPFLDKVIMLSPQEVMAATKNLDSLLALRKKVFASSQ